MLLRDLPARLDFLVLSMALKPNTVIGRARVCGEGEAVPRAGVEHGTTAFPLILPLYVGSTSTRHAKI